LLRFYCWRDHGSTSSSTLRWRGFCQLVWQSIEYPHTIGSRHHAMSHQAVSRRTFPGGATHLRLLLRSGLFSTHDVLRLRIVWFIIGAAYVGSSCRYSPVGFGCALFFYPRLPTRASRPSCSGRLFRGAHIISDAGLRLWHNIGARATCGSCPHCSFCCDVLDGTAYGKKGPAAASAKPKPLSTPGAFTYSWASAVKFGSETGGRNTVKMCWRFRSCFSQFCNGSLPPP